MPDVVTAPRQPIPPPILQLPWGQVGPGGAVTLSPSALGFLQLLWSSLQGQGGVFDQVVAGYSSPGLEVGQIESLLAADGRAAAFSGASVGAFASLAGALQRLRDYVAAEAKPGELAAVWQRLRDLEAFVVANEGLGVRAVVPGTGMTGGGAAGGVKLSIADTGVAAGTYGDATHIPEFTVNAEGQITSVVLVPIGAGGSQWLPLVTGVEPVALVSDGAGHLITVAYAP